MEQVINSYKIIVAGDTGTGKSSLIVKFTDNSFTNTFNSTIGVDFRTKALTVNGQIVRLYIWDTAGQERFKSITRSYYNTAEGIILTFDLTNKETFITLPTWLEEFEHYEKLSCPILLVGTKSDMYNSKQINRMEIEAFIESYTPKFNMQYIETSAKNGRGIHEAFYKMGEELLKIKTVIPISMQKNVQSNSIVMNDELSRIFNEPPKQQSCCSIL